jgi:phosphoribulokinase
MTTNEQHAQPGDILPSISHDGAIMPSHRKASLYERVARRAQPVERERAMPHRPIMLGVVGDSAAGKTTTSAGIAAILGADRVTIIGVDDYHRYDRVQRRALNMTALHPECNYIDIIEQHLRSLSEGQPILKPVYNHKAGIFEPPEYIKPREFVIVEGLLGFHTPRLRDCFHVKVFLDPDEDLRRAWKLKRDCTTRGYTPAEVLAELALREPEAAMFVRPQRSWGDIVVRFYAPDGPSDIDNLNVQLILRTTLPHPDLSAVAAQSDNQRMHLRVGRDDGRLVEFLDVDGRLTKDQAALIEEAIWANTPDVQRSRPDQIGMFTEGEETRQSDLLGLVQLLIGRHLLQARKEKEQLLRQSQSH